MGLGLGCVWVSDFMEGGSGVWGLAFGIWVYKFRGFRAYLRVCRGLGVRV